MPTRQMLNWFSANTGWLVALGLFAMIGVGCAPSPAQSGSSEKAKPAKVEKIPHETDLATVTLSEDAERRLAIKTVAAELKSIPRHRFLGAQAMVPSGSSIAVAAPLAGTVATAGSSLLPVPGQAISLNEPLMIVKPLLSAERDVPTPAEKMQIVGARANLMAAHTVAAGDVQRTGAEVEAARINVDRAQKLLADRAGSQRAADDAVAQWKIATANLSAAQQREKQLIDLLAMLADPKSDGEPAALPITAPISGVLNRIDVREGQTVVSGTALCEIVNLDAIWLQVPVFVDQVADIDQSSPAQLVQLSGQPLTVGQVSADPVAAPPSANVTQSTVDLYYAVDNRSLQLRPGQRIGVQLPLVSESEVLALPIAAILYDIYGNSWVYCQQSDHQYVRQRVVIDYVSGQQAVLSSGPKLGTRVVVDGAAELFGTEFGAGK